MCSPGVSFGLLLGQAEGSWMSGVLFGLGVGTEGGMGSGPRLGHIVGNGRKHGQDVETGARRGMGLGFLLGGEPGRGNWLGFLLGLVFFARRFGRDVLGVSVGGSRLGSLVRVNNMHTACHR
jgi:hypothetical protein